MTKKVEKILKNVEEKYITNVEAYNVKLINFDRYTRRVMEINREVSGMINAMYFYNLISHKNFKQIIENLNDMFYKYLEYYDYI